MVVREGELEMGFSLSELQQEDAVPVIDIFNYYVEHGFAAYFERKVPVDFFNGILQITRGYPRYAVRSEQGQVVGFGFMRAYSPIPAFKKTAEITYFMAPDCLGQGAGQLIMDRMIEDARKMGVETILASVSSRNERSLAFHKKHGFSVCGVFENIGVKFGQDFDMVWLQRVLG